MPRHCSPMICLSWKKSVLKGTRISRDPKDLWIDLIMFWIASEERKSLLNRSTLTELCSEICLASSWNSGLSAHLPWKMMFAPADANVLSISKPRPFVDPVTNAVFPASVITSTKLRSSYQAKRSWITFVSVKFTHYGQQCPSTVQSMDK